MYAIVDIETTGSNAQFGKITEIAIYIHDGKQVVDQFITLINPECFIPPFITNLTGITNEMVKDAPRFYEVAKKIVEITKGHIFIAHNVSFDYGYLKAEFKSLGYDFELDTLCTVQLSKKILPGYSSYGLGSLCKRHGIEIVGRHRAGGDAFATTKLVDILLQQDKENHFELLVRKEVLPDEVNGYLKKENLKTLPEETGIYYFLNEKQQVIYVGKGKNIQKRVVQHFLSPKSKKQQLMLESTAEVNFEITGSELIALLKESEEIKRLQPLYNTKQTRNSFKYGIFADLQIDGVMHLSILPTNKAVDPIALYTNKAEAEKALFSLVKRHRLCPQKTGLERGYTGKACFHHGIDLCDGICLHQETSDAYNGKVTEAINNLLFESSNFLIVDKGRHGSEKAVVKIENGKYYGFGFADQDCLNGGMELLYDIAKRKPFNREVNSIIKNYINKNNGHEIINF